MTRKTATNSRKIAEECVEFARRNGGCACQADRPGRAERRASLRMFSAHHVWYCPNWTLSEDHTKLARMLDISLDGMVLWCREAFTQGMLIHVSLPQPYGMTAWIRGRAVYCLPDNAHHYRVGIAFILDQD